MTAAAAHTVSAAPRRALHPVLTGTKRRCAAPRRGLGPPSLRPLAQQLRIGAPAMRLRSCNPLGIQPAPTLHARRPAPHPGICYRCGGAGHMLRDCTQAAGSAAAQPCIRCGRDGCACRGAGDFMRCVAIQAPPLTCPQGLCSMPGHPLPPAIIVPPACVARLALLHAAPEPRFQAPLPGPVFEPDSNRFDGHCSGDYHPDDIARSRCFVCGALGHLSCQPAPLELPRPSCYHVRAGRGAGAEGGREWRSPRPSCSK